MKDKGERKERVKGFDKRLKFIIGNESVNSFANKCEVTESLIRRYLSGRSLPVIDIAVRIADVASVDVEWLVTGKARNLPWEGPGGVLEINPNLLVNVIEAVEESIATTGRSVRARKKAEFIVLLYDLARKKREEKDIDRDTVFRMVRSVMED